MKKAKKIIFFIVGGILSVLGVVFIFFVIYEVHSSYFVGTSSILQKIVFSVERKWREIKWRRPIVGDYLSDVGYEPFIAYPVPMAIDLDSGHRSTTVDKRTKDYASMYWAIPLEDIWPNLPVPRMRDVIWPITPLGTWNNTHQIVELRFTNAKFVLRSVEAYNPTITNSFLAPYQAIDGRRLGMWWDQADATYDWDFCIVLFTTSVIPRSQRDILSDCHLIVVPAGIYGYPYVGIRAGMLPLNTGSDAEMKVIYHPYDLE